MKILLLVQKQKRAIIDHLFASIRNEDTECDLLQLSDEEQRDIADYFRRNIDIAKYDRIIFMLRFKKIRLQLEFLQSIDNLVFLEYDAWQNYAPVKNRGKFIQLYRKVPWARIIVSSHVLAERIRDEGFDAVFVPKGYDDTVLHDLQRDRPIELAFIGSTNNSIYNERVKHLRSLSRRVHIEMARTHSAQEYLDKLNEIKYFVSADIGCNEYMLKNFEAMACGCVVLAFNHGDEENAALGFRDMENIVLYRNEEEFFTKLEQLRGNPTLSATIAANGRQLAQTRNAFSVLGPKIVAALEPPLRARSDYPGRATSWLEHLTERLGFR